MMARITALRFLFPFLITKLASCFLPFLTSSSGRRSFVPVLSSASSSDNEKDDSLLWETILKRFQGDFDNYYQVVQDREQGLLPREGGGHEHIHCTLIPVSETARLAAFYFDGVPNAIFRFRYYHLQPVSNETAVDTILYTLHPELDKQLRQCPDPMQWPQVFHSFTDKDRIRLLPACDVRWSWILDPIEHDYATHYNKTCGIHAVMVYGEALVESQMMPGQQILIRDQLSLWSDELWIHDRGFDPKTGDFIYGNHKEIPYRLERVATVDDNERTVSNEDLAWTLGPDYRTEERYGVKMAVIGGPSRPER